MREISGIRTQVIGGIVMLAIAATGIMGVFSLKIMEQRVLYSKVREAEILADFFKVNNGGTVATGQLALQAKHLIKSGRIRDIIIENKDGKILFRNGSPPAPEAGRPLLLNMDFAVRHSGQSIFSPASGTFNVSLFLASGVKVAFSLSLSGAREELLAVRNFIFWFALGACVIIIAFGAYILSKSVIVPIRRLDRIASQIAGGDFSVRADGFVSNDEIGSLAVSFNRMAESVEEKILSIESVNTDLVSTQEMLVMTEKLATAGRLAAGIAHEIGNPLGAVSGYLGMLGKGDVEADEAKEMIERMDLEISRINAIVTDFLDIARPARDEQLPADVNSVLNETLAIMRAHKKFDSVVVKVELAEGLPGAFIDASRLKQVFINLFLNSADAMEGSGVIVVTTGLCLKSEFDFMPSRRRTDRAGGFSVSNGHIGELAPLSSDETRVIVASFTDNGPGISEAERAKIFDPFYTTKEPGKGTGLGLFISEGIVETYRGRINVSSKESEGTTFEVILEVSSSRE